MTSRNVYRKSRKRVYDSLTILPDYQQDVGSRLCDLEDTNNLRVDLFPNMVLQEGNVPNDDKQEEKCGWGSDYSTNSDEGSDFSDVDDGCRTLTLAEELHFFFMFYNVSHAAMAFLLSLLLRHGLEVPRSVYLLKKMSNSPDILTKKIGSGDFAYIPIKDNIKYCLENKLLQLRQLPIVSGFHELRCSVHIDGLPLFKSSNVGLWTIILKINGVFRPLPLGCFCGTGKPDLNLFISDLVLELKHLTLTGMEFADSLLKVVHVKYIADSPARSFIQCIKGHSSKKGCGYCRCEAVYCTDRIVYPHFSSELRDDDSYAKCKENNQSSLSPLCSVSRLLSDFPPDYMHCVCLGVVRKLMHFYFKRQTKLHMKCRLPASIICQVDDIIRICASFTPREFQRRPRPINELEHYKASEFRSFVLYFGPLILRKHLSKDFYTHFIHLHFAIYVLTSKSLSHLYEHAHRCLEIFVSQTEVLFGNQALSYNMHILLHLHYFVKMYGVLDEFSAFEFENYLSVLKRRVKKTRCIFQETVSQLISIRSLYTSDPVKELYFSENSPNNCAFIGNVPIIVDKVLSDKNLCGFVLEFIRPLYKTPYSSQELDIGYYTRTSKFICGLPLRKAILLMIGQEYLVIPYVV
jgi:hypothetical protein